MPTTLIKIEITGLPREEKDQEAKLLQELWKLFGKLSDERRVEFALSE